MIIAWFSCGVTSAVACKIALSLYEDVQLYYIETGSGLPITLAFSLIVKVVRTAYSYHTK